MNDSYFRIQGLAGKRVLKGTIPVNGAKNAALKAIAATVLFRDEVTLKRVPLIEDVFRIADLLESAGGDVHADTSRRMFKIRIPDNISGDLDPSIARQIRSSIVLTGPLLARTGQVSFPHPGGCVIGERSIDLFLDSFRALGASVRHRGDKYVITAPQGGLVGTTLFLKSPSVTATETLMMAGVLSKGQTVIRNAAMEPEIAHLATFLNACGARIDGAGTPVIRIRGRSLLRSRGKAYVTLPDRIEAGSFIILAALAAKDVTVAHCDPSHIESLLYTLESIGVSIKVGKDSVRITSPRRLPYKATSFKTHEYPGFPTDLQAPMTTLLTQADGESLVFETIFEGRLNYVESLKRMNASIQVMDPHRVLVNGPTELVGRRLESPDLRAGLAFVIAATIARGVSYVHNAYNIDRGYEAIEERFSSIGVDIERVNGAD